MKLCKRREYEWGCLGGGTAAKFFTTGCVVDGGRGATGGEDLYGVRGGPPWGHERGGGGNSEGGDGVVGEGSWDVLIRNPGESVNWDESVRTLIPKDSCDL